MEEIRDAIVDTPEEVEIKMSVKKEWVDIYIKWELVDAITKTEFKQIREEF